MILYLLRMRRNVNRNVFKRPEKCKRDAASGFAHIFKIDGIRHSQARLGDAP